MEKREWTVGLLSAVIFALLAVCGCDSKSDAPDVITVAMEEISTFDIPQRNHMDLAKGVWGRSTGEPSEQVKRYPELRTDKPVYGKLPVYGDLENVVKTLYWVVEESAGPGKGYDTLYVDRNNDLDLTNDEPLSAQESPPQGAEVKEEYVERQTWFSPFTLEFEHGDNGSHSVEIMPRLRFGEDSARMYFVPTKARKGRFALVGKDFDVYLSCDAYDAIRGRLNDPLCSFFLVNDDDPRTPATWEWAEFLCAMRRIGGIWYQFSATVRGDKVTATKYKGDFGTFEIGAGKRAFKNLGINGPLFSCDHRAVLAGGEVDEAGAKDMARSCRLPTGDYVLAIAWIQYGPLSIQVSQNYHIDGRRRAKIHPKLAFDQWVYGITIRKDRPFVLDFSNEPEVLFAEPTSAQRFKTGEEVKVMAVLIDPVLDIMIRRLIDTRQKVPYEYARRDGSKVSGEEDRSLDPKVVVTRLDGTVVAEGIMPFG
ncbi:MAG: hypothetical protein JSU70_13000 [Phycisphaerales bacterium]|nr:MAG: hypothetical protein JSU70_13000 [Phycisphaerales bacterium]